MSPATPISKGPAQPQFRYRMEGQGSEEFDLVALRDQIRNGTLQPENQLMIVGTDLWKPASEYPVLTRYFSLVKPAAQAGMAAAPSAPAPSMASRIGAGLSYPFSSLSSIVLVAATFVAGLHPLVRLVAGLVSGVYAVTVVRVSSEGRTSAPSFADAGGPLEWIMTFLRLIAVTLISAWPIVLVVMLSFTGMIRSAFVFLAAILVMIAYFPASLATVAVWKSIKMSVSVQQIFRFIGILGRDYYVVVGIWILSAVAIAFATPAAGLVLPRMFVAAVSSVASLYLEIYASHLLGWAVYRNRDQF
jgi:hypothetical protein